MPEVTVDVSWSLDQPISTSRGDVVARAMVESCTVDPVNTSDWRWSLATEDGEVLAELTTVTEEPLEVRRMDDPGLEQPHHWSRPSTCKVAVAQVQRRDPGLSGHVARALARRSCRSKSR